MTVLDRFRLNYRLTVDDTGVHADIGRPPPAFLSAVRDVVQLHAISQGQVECKGHGPRARLRFSADFPERGRQAIRNVWSPPTIPGGGGNGRRRAGP